MTEQKQLKIKLLELEIEKKKLELERLKTEKDTLITYFPVIVPHSIIPGTTDYPFPSFPWFQTWC